MVVYQKEKFHAKIGSNSRAHLQPKLSQHRLHIHGSEGNHHPCEGVGIMMPKWTPELDNKPQPYRGSSDVCPPPMGAQLHNGVCFVDSIRNIPLRTSYQPTQHFL